MTKPIKLYQYPFKVDPEIEEGDYQIRNKIYNYCGIGEKKKRKKLKDFYGECFISGDSLYAVKEVKEMKTFDCKLYSDGINNYTITFQPKSKERIINQEDLEKDPLTKQFIEMLIRDILHGNPNLDFYKGLFIKKNDSKVIESQIFKNASFTFYPGYTTSFMETEGGNYINVTLKNKILSTDNILDILKKNNYKKNKESITKYLVNKKFKVSYAKKNYIINEIDFDKNPKTQSCNYDKETVTLAEYYKKRYDITIKDLTQPLLIVKRKDDKGKDIDLHFIPELCHLSELDERLIKDREFMKKLSNYTKLSPKDRINKTNEFLNLLKDPTKHQDDNEKLSAKEKSEMYGIEIKALNQLHKAYYMKEAILIGGEKKPIDPTHTFDVLSKKDMKKWLCIYRTSNDEETYDIIYKKAENFYKTLSEASYDYNLEISKPKWIEMNEDDEVDEWINTVEDYMKEDKYSFVVFLLDDYDDIYKDLKVHSLCHNGYVSQVVKFNSLKKNAMSVCSKILLQINSKLSGVSYMLKLGDDIKKRKLMIIGVDSSHIKGKRTGVAMVSTINTSFTNFYNKEIIIYESNKTQLQFCISGFIKEALAQYEDFNKKLPNGIIIYRQGVSFQQKEFLKKEVNNIQKICDDNKILYYYILVNTKTTYKFFEKNQNNYDNPKGGLLVLDGVTNRKFFEFYIQPQKVTGGSATPSCFHVAYGNLNFPEAIPKLTFDLCHLYSNWQGAVRVPHVLKSAEKLSKMTAKYTLEELNDNLKIGQSYL